MVVIFLSFRSLEVAFSFALKIAHFHFQTMGLHSLPTFFAPYHYHFLEEHSHTDLIDSAGTCSLRKYQDAWACLWMVQLLSAGTEDGVQRGEQWRRPRLDRWHEEGSETSRDRGRWEQLPPGARRMPVWGRAR